MNNISEENFDTVNIDEDVIKKIKERQQIENVIGEIKIEKIGIEFPILAETSDELMKIAPTKYCGPRPNAVGNLVIIGHNFYDGTLFSNLNNLLIGDVVEITDKSNTTIKYNVYEKRVIEPDDFSCTSQDTDNKSIVTLITCINGTDNRLIVKCMEQR